ncbi:hypothetical protein [Microbacterium sp. NPDC055683]
MKTSSRRNGAAERPRREDLGDVDVIPGWLSTLLYAILTIGGLASLPNIGSYSLLPVGTLLDAWIALFVAYCIVKGRTRTTGTILLLGAYFLTRVVPALYIGAPLGDFFQAYRWVFYLAAFCFAVGKSWGSVTPLKRVLWTLLALSFAKAVATLFVRGLSARSGLLTENNFELALYCAAAIAIWPHLSSRERRWTLALLAAVVVLSGSRSGTIAFAVVLIFAISQARQASLVFRYLVVLIIPLAVYAIIEIFVSRAESGGVDRINFLNVFLRETSDWNLIEWMVGTVPITPLSPEGCNTLAYYVYLFSSTGDGSCYSVIFHAFMMRVIFDAGLLGLFLTLFIAWSTLRGSGSSLATTLAVVGIAIANSFSVSGFNSPYVAVAVLISISVAGSSSLTAPPTEFRVDKQHSRR